LTSGEEATVFLVDNTYRLLYQTGAQTSVEDLQSHPGVSSALRGESGTTYLSVSGDESVISFSPVTPTNWALIMEEPWESVANPLLISTQNAPLALVPVLLLALVALWFGARQIIQPLQALESQAAALSWGDYEAISEDVGGIEEIQRLQSELKHLARKVQSSQEGLRGYIGAITTGQEEERNRLARELHDDTLQALIALNQRIQLALMPKDTPVTSAALEEIQELTVSTIDNLRRITRALRPQYLDDLGLVTALEMLARETSENTGIPVHFSVHGDQERLAQDIELALFRMAQEGLNNVARHSEAAQASLLISFEAHQLRMQVQDDGKGFEMPKSPAEFAPDGHFGLLGIHERAELIGAHLEIDSMIGKGTRLKITLFTV
jgi:two-component system sensor histidine kinase UhpB